MKATSLGTKTPEETATTPVPSLPRNFFPASADKALSMIRTAQQTSLKRYL
jgi:hypothetical protein